MSTASILSSASSTATTSSSSVTSDSLNLDTNDFLKLLLTELQNQDPLDPTSTSDILTQVSEIKAIKSNDDLSNTLSSLKLQQQLYTGSSLLKSTITGTNNSGATVTGTVDSVKVSNSTVYACVGSESVSLANITNIQAAK
ncbi:MAG: flagellar hook capping FlgD N-terminal domain-containing protein [Thermoguttaceae bacterium]|jgi:flagellar basal-body rod modification protein FlgD